MSRSHLVDKMYKFRQLFPHDSKKVVCTDFKEEKIDPDEILALLRKLYHGAYI